jgi:hypothetical protein
MFSNHGLLQMKFMNNLGYAADILDHETAIFLNLPPSDRFFQYPRAVVFPSLYHRALYYLHDYEHSQIVQPFESFEQLEPLEQFNGSSG